MAKGFTIHQIVVMMFSSFYTLYSIIGLLFIIPVGLSLFLMNVPFISTALTMVIVYFIFFIMGFTGLYALVKEDSRKMKIFGILVVIYIIILTLLLILFAVTMFWLVNKNNDNFKYDMDTYNTSRLSRKFVDAIQVSFKCCGANSYSEWGSNVPLSCCKDLGTTATCDELNDQGCNTARNKWWITAASAFIPSICFLVFHVFTAKYSFILAKDFANP